MHKELKKVLEGGVYNENYRVDWALLSRKQTAKLKKQDFTKVNSPGVELWTKRSCYGSLLNNFNEQVHVYSKFPFTNNHAGILSIEKNKKWLSLARKHKLVPHYITGNKCVKKDCVEAIVNLKDAPNKALVYIYLTIIRAIQESPGFVEAMLYLVCKEKIDFFVAFTICHRSCISGTGHSVLNYSQGYPNGKSFFPEKEFDLSYGKALYKFIQNPEKYSTASFFSKFNVSWNMHTTLQKVNVKTFKITFDKAKDKETIDYMYGE